jgi:hypothetical protein
MAAYSIRYVCESTLISDEEINLDFEGQTARFSFPPELRERGELHATLEIEAENWKEADLKAQRILQPIMDALSFASGQPLLIRYWDFIRKAETGSELRKALWVQASQTSNRFTLNTALAEEAQKVLQKNLPPAISLCWHRYAGHRGYWLDRFVFQWLAFESLAGGMLVNRQCEKCGHVHSHQGANRAEAFRIFQAADPRMSNKEFRDEVWGKDRNCVFHGSKYPGPQHLQRLNALFPRIRRACEMEFSRLYGVKYRERPIGQAETHCFMYHFIEWRTADREKAVAEDFPWDALKQEFTNRKSGEMWISVPSEQFTPLDFQRDSAAW